MRSFYIFFLIYIHKIPAFFLVSFLSCSLCVFSLTYSLSYLGERDLSQHYFFLFVFSPTLCFVYVLTVHRTRRIVSLFSFCLAPYGFFTVLSFISTYNGPHAVNLVFLSYLALSAFFFTYSFSFLRTQDPRSWFIRSSISFLSLFPKYIGDAFFLSSSLCCTSLFSLSATDTTYDVFPFHSFLPLFQLSFFCI